MRVATYVVLVALTAFGCAGPAPEVEPPAVSRTPVASPQEPAGRTVEEPEDARPVPAESTPAASARWDSEQPDMTQVLRERGIPDRVDNEGPQTLWIYRTGEGAVEVFTFQKGRFVGHQTLP